VPHKLAQKYSSVVLNQNRAVANVNDYAFGPFGDYRQEFFLPSDYRRGTESGELRYPDLSGIQLLVDITAGSARHAAFSYKVEYQVFGLGWITVTEGVAIGAPTDGKTWMTAYFDEPVEIDQTKAAARWRIDFEGRMTSGVKDFPVEYSNGVAVVFGNRVVADLEPYEPWPFDFQGTPSFLYYDPSNSLVTFSYQQGIQKFWYSSPNPLALPYNLKAQERDVNEYDDITGSSGDASFCFRILALTAEDGVDFLGNQYRSVVTRNTADSISTALGADRDSFWLSKPNPSKFAVENLYFDVRQQGSRKYGVQNELPNPSFENADTSTYFAAYQNGGTATLTRSTDFARSGTYCGKLTATSALADMGAVTGLNGSSFVSVKPGDVVQAYGYSRAATMPRPSNMILLFWTAGDVLIGTASVTGAFVTNAVGSWTKIPTVTATAPANAAKSTVYTVINAPANGEIHYLDDIIAVKNSPIPDYFDGNTPGHVWSGTAHASPSVELIEPSASDVSRVIDRVLVDPITPGVYFSVYYTDEGDPGVNEEGWESKLWTRVPQTYRAERRETHVFPEPVKAKYVKIEFSHLQARHYAPGNFQQSIRYKKHPKWVLDYFLARVQVNANNPFLAGRTAVIYDALDLAYNYYLDDLGQEPSASVDVNSTALTQVVDFLRDRSDSSDRIDPGTLDKISLLLDTYRQHPALRGVPQTLLGEYARQSVDFNSDYTVEGQAPAPIDSPDVSTLDRDRVVIEQNYPVMFFYLPCRHGYREVEAKFSHDRAYFAGVRELAFLRDNYMTAYDTGTYIEPAADTQNIERNEFLT
jgi:hypothetical protein